MTQTIMESYRTAPFREFSLNLHGRLVRFDRVQIMGIINVTPDSFYAHSRHEDNPELVARSAVSMMEHGADWIDLGACSTRPSSLPPDAEEETRRLIPSLAAIRKALPDAILSVDTFRAEVARRAIDSGADIVNDISCLSDPEMLGTVASMHIPYILTHSRGTSANMSTLTDYSAYGNDVAAGVVAELSGKLRSMHLAGVADVIIDPGFGFAKTLRQNYRLLQCTSDFADLFKLPILVGVSRKSMFTQALNTDVDHALPATIAANVIAMLGGASILRVHDPAQAAHARKIVELTLQIS